MINAAEYSHEEVRGKPILLVSDITKILDSRTRKDNEPINFENCYIFASINFTNVNFEKCNFRNCMLNNCSFTNCSFENCNFEGADIRDVNFTNCNLVKANFSNSFWLGVTTNNTDCSQANFYMGHLKKCSFNNETKFHETDFLQLSINEVYFHSVDVKEPKNIETVNITMGGATRLEVEKHAQAIRMAMAQEEDLEPEM